MDPQAWQQLGAIWIFAPRFTVSLRISLTNCILWVFGAANVHGSALIDENVANHGDFAQI
jgi:hypothetical protein